MKGNAYLSDMKYLHSSLFIVLFVLGAHAQYPSMTIQHSGLTPNDTLWVAPSDSIQFIYGGGGPHPMTSGHGAKSSPVFFPTVTVTSSNTTALFTLDSVGTYIFHCGTNPNNSNNWGTIIVTESASLIENHQKVRFFPNPGRNVIHLDAPYSMEWGLLDMTGQWVLRIRSSGPQASRSIDALPAGAYLIYYRPEGGTWQTERFIKLP